MSVTFRNNILMREKQYYFALLTYTIKYLGGADDEEKGIPLVKSVIYIRF